MCVDEDQEAGVTNRQCCVHPPSICPAQPPCPASSCLEREEDESVSITEINRNQETEGKEEGKETEKRQEREKKRLERDGKKERRKEGRERRKEEAAAADVHLAQTMSLDSR